jgi:hypothetical protein
MLTIISVTAVQHFWTAAIKLLAGTFNQAFPRTPPPPPRPHPPLTNGRPARSGPPTSDQPSPPALFRPLPPGLSQVSPGSRAGGGTHPAHLSAGGPALRVHQLITNAISTVLFLADTCTAAQQQQQTRFPPHGLTKGQSWRRETGRQSPSELGTRDSLGGREARHQVRTLAGHAVLARRERGAPSRKDSGWARGTRLEGERRAVT